MLRSIFSKFKRKQTIDREVQQVQLEQSLQRSRNALKVQVAHHEKYCEQEAKQRQIAIQMAKSGNRHQSLFHVSCALRLRKQMAALQAMIGNLQDSIYHLEVTTGAMQAAGALRVGSDALRSAHGGNVVIEIENAMEMLRDQSENTEEISDALQDGTQVAVDAESVLDEWIQESATQQAVPSVPHPVPVLHELPAVPSSRPRSPPQAPAVAISDADRSRELQSAVWT